MKKFLVALLVALCGAVSLFADDVADVKAVIVKNNELNLRNDFLATLALCTPDYQEIVSGEVFTYQQIKWLLTSLDGKHPKEFLLFFVSRRTEDKLPPAELHRKIVESPVPGKLLQMYEQAIRDAVEYNNIEAEAWRKTARFLSVKVDGDEAVAVVEHDSRDPASGTVRRKCATIFLRRVNGVWLMYKCVR